LAADVQQAARRDEFGRHYVSIQTLDAADVGVPQARRWPFVICDRPLGCARRRCRPDGRG
jgi:site-specific DNA-cytosine methylase